MPKRPIGTGPFRFAEFVPGSYVRLARFDDFFGGKPQLDAVTFKVMPDLEQQFARLQSGPLDWMLIEPYQMDAIKGNPKLRVNEVLSNTYFFVSLNNQIFPFNDKQVRQALASMPPIAVRLSTVACTVWRSRRLPPLHRCSPSTITTALNVMTSI